MNGNNQGLIADWSRQVGTDLMTYRVRAIRWIPSLEGYEKFMSF